MDDNLGFRLDLSYSFGAKHAIGILIAFVVVMAVANSSAAFLIKKIVDSGYAGISTDNEQIAGALIVLRQLASLIAAFFLLFFYLRISFRGALKAKVHTNIGLVKTSHRWIISAALFGFLFAFILSRVIAPFFPPEVDFVPNPLMAATQTGNWIQYLTALVVVCIAPAIEELLFRGILYHGFSASWGKIPAVIVITIIFVLLHDETLSGGYWLGIFSLIAVSMSLIFARELSGSLLPAVLIHSGFNLAMVLPG